MAEDKHYPGELVWIPDKEQVWLAAEVTKVSDTGCHVKVPDVAGEVEVKKGTPVLQRSQGEYTGGSTEVIEDLTALLHLHEASVLNSLHHAFDLDHIYTFTGPILIAINPFKGIPGLYDAAMMQKYLANPEVLKHPHVYATGSLAFQGLRQKRTSQTVLISGESGAGKTETTKHVMKLVCSAGGGAGDIEHNILSSNPILEALGNAKTLRNNNSSRFGKFIELQFEDKDGGDLQGSSLVTYLLEKVRVCNQLEGERNYHVFYQGCVASLAAPEVRKDGSKGLSLKGFGKINTFRYLINSTCEKVERKDDHEEFDELVCGLRTVGYTEDELEGIFQIIAAVLNIGNMVFDAPADNGDASKIDDKTKGMMDISAELLKVPRDKLETAMCNRTIKVGGDSTSAPVKIAQACDARDALARHLYGALFEEIVAKVNVSIGAKAQGKKIFVGILDIFGFECFVLNSFEQLCINFTNERLQQFFNNFVFKLEQALYNKEGIPWNALDFPDNQDSLDLIQAKPAGIFAMLDEECKLPKGTDAGFNSKIWKAFEKNPNFQIIRKKPDYFVIKHFAGPVEYLSTGFLDKNRDALRDDIVVCCHASESPLVTALFVESMEKMEAAANARGPKKAATISSKFKLQLGELMDSIDKTDPHFIRCIKPNPQNKPDDYNRHGVAEQLRYQGVLQVVELSRKGYPVRTKMSDVWTNYKLLVSPACLKEVAALDPCVRAQKMMKDLDKKFGLIKSTTAPEVAVGKSMIFFKKEAFERLQQEQVAVLSVSAIKIQKVFRGRCARKRIALKKMCIVAIQTAIRGFLARKKGRALLENKRAAVTIQSHWRGSRGRIVASEYKKVKAAKKIQSAWRASRERKIWIPLRKSANLVQMRWRIRVAKAQAKELRNNAKEVGSLATKVQQQADELRIMKKDQEALEGKKIQLEQAGHEMEKLKARNAELEAENAELKKQTKELNETVANLKASGCVPGGGGGGGAGLALPGGGGGRQGSKMPEQKATTRRNSIMTQRLSVANLQEAPKIMANIMGHRSSISIASSQARELLGGGKPGLGSTPGSGPMVASLMAPSPDVAGLDCVEEHREENAVTCLCFGHEKDPKHPTLLAVASMTGNINVYRARRTPMDLERVGLEKEEGLPSEEEGGKGLTLYSKMEGHTRAVTSMFFADGQDQLVSTSVDKTFRIWNVTTGVMLTLFTDSTPIGVAARLPTTSDVFATANSKAIVRLINSKSGAVFQKLKMENEVRAMAFDTTGNFLTLGTRVGTLHVLDCTDTKQPDGHSSYELTFKIQKFKLSQGGVTCITFVAATDTVEPKLLVNTMDSSVAVLGCHCDEHKRIINIQVIHRVKVVHTVLPLQCCYSPAGDGYLVSGSEDNKAYIYNLNDYRLQQLSRHHGAVVAVAVNQQNSLLASADSNGVIVLWRRSSHPLENAASVLRQMAITGG